MPVNFFNVILACNSNNQRKILKAVNASLSVVMVGLSPVKAAKGMLLGVIYLLKKTGCSSSEKART